VAGRPLQSIFIGGGTPSLFTPAAVETLLSAILARVSWADDIEITMEANPGTLEKENFAGYRDAGINRLSLGVQSFATDCLQRLGRMHSPEEAVEAVEQAQRAGFEYLNLDLMFGLPGQSRDGAATDLLTALTLNPGHLSYYQLTLEPNTAFYRSPPPLPAEDEIWRMLQQGSTQLAQAGYQQYEVSAYALNGQTCRHNLNYWTFGDYLGIGAGAHGKITKKAGVVIRYSKWRNPAEYSRKVQLSNPIQAQRILSEDDLLLEFLMNHLRLSAGFDKAFFFQRTGLAYTRLQTGMSLAFERGLLQVHGDTIQTTPMGRRYLNDLLGLFIPTD
jgi:oxygen-independent coproporphyrinogen-3 oxidase